MPLVDPSPLSLLHVPLLPHFFLLFPLLLLLFQLFFTEIRFWFISSLLISIKIILHCYSIASCSFILSLLQLLFRILFTLYYSCYFLLVPYSILSSYFFPFNPLFTNVQCFYSPNYPFLNFICPLSTTTFPFYPLPPPLPLIPFQRQVTYFSITLSFLHHHT